MNFIVKKRKHFVKLTNSFQDRKYISSALLYSVVKLLLDQSSMTTHVDCTVTHSGIGNSFQHVDFELVNDHEDKEAAEMTNMCPRLRHCIQHCIQPVLVESHPLTADAPWYQRFLNNFFCPPHSRMGGIIFMIVLTSCIWVTLFSVTGEEALPGGNLFALLALFVLCWTGGYIARLTRLPSLLGKGI